MVRFQASMRGTLKPSRIAAIAGAVLAVTGVAALAPGSSAVASKVAGARAVAAAAKAFSASVGYHQTNGGKVVGQNAIGIEGGGTFSGKLRGRATADLRAFAAAAGLPLPMIVAGGTFKSKVDMKGATLSGVIAVRFKHSALGTLCAAVSANDFKVVNGYYVPTRGSITAAGGKGAAATWKGTVHYTVTGLTPGRTSYTAQSSGSLSGAIGKARGESTACKAVARQH
jgi:hypothetical protein